MDPLLALVLYALHESQFNTRQRVRVQVARAIREDRLSLARAEIADMGASDHWKT
jgi:hypothetical protein